MSEDPRYCGSGRCIIDDGRCWCGKQWDGEKMCFAGSGNLPAATAQVPQVEDEDAD